MRFTSRAARVRFIERIIVSEPYRHTTRDLATMTEVVYTTVWRDLLLLQTETPRLPIQQDDDGRWGMETW